MLLKNIASILPPAPTEQTVSALSGKIPSESISLDSDSTVFVTAMDTSLSKAIGEIQNGKSTHFYSWGNYNLVRLIIHLIKQTGPVNAFMTSYSFSQKSIEQLQNLLSKKQLLSFRVLIDNRVKSMSPIPFQMLMTSFDYRCTSVHAKVALLWNENWKISIVTSQNATDNPKLERGTIFTDESIFNFDFNNLTDEYKRGTP
jgi:hypothetical protein